MKKKKLILYSLVIVFGACFFLFSPARVSAAPVEFTDDVILDMSGLGEGVYVESGSKCTSLTISGTQLSVNTISATPDFFSLKTTTHKVLKLTPSGGAANLTTFDSAYYSTINDSISEWTETSLVSVTHIAGVPAADTEYKVKVAGSEIPLSPFLSNPLAEITFTRTGEGEEVYTITYEVPYPSFGFVISSTFDTGIEKGVAYNSIMWQGELPAGTSVELELATSDCSNGATNPPDCNTGAWVFKGASDGCCDFYPDPDVPLEIKGICRESFNNKRYYRYKVILNPDSSGQYSPTVEKVIVNYSP